MRPLASSIKGKRAIDQMWMDWRLIQGDLALSSLSSLTRALLSTVCQTLLSLCRSCDVLSFLIPRSVLCRLSTTPGVTASLSFSISRSLDRLASSCKLHACLPFTRSARDGRACSEEGVERRRAGKVGGRSRQYCMSTHSWCLARRGSRCRCCCIQRTSLWRKPLVGRWRVADCKFHSRDWMTGC